MALTDEIALRRSARNLVDNAVRAAGPDGRVEVAVRREGSRAVLEVSDDGPGFGRMPTSRGWGWSRCAASSAGSEVRSTSVAAGSAARV